MSDTVLITLIICLSLIIMTVVDTFKGGKK